MLWLRLGANHKIYLKGGEKMDKQEFGLLAAAIRTYYPKEQILPNAQAMELWYRELQDIPFSIAEAALRKWVNTNKWSPSIAEIREMTVDVKHGEAMTWGESWEKLKLAVRKYGRDAEAEAMNSFDPLTRKCVKIFGYRAYCNSDVSNEMADRAHYQRIFETMAQRERTNQQLALPLQEAINRIQLENKGGFKQLGTGDWR
jgi:hypothetical protein